MADETLADLIEVLLRQRDPERTFIGERDLEAAYDAGGRATCRPAGAKRAYSLLGKAARESGGIASYRVLGKYTAFLLVVAATKADIALTLMNADSGVTLCHCMLQKGRSPSGKPEYLLVLGAAETTTPFGVDLMDALLQASLRKEGLATLG